MRSIRFFLIFINILLCDETYGQQGDTSVVDSVVRDSVTNKNKSNSARINVGYGTIDKKDYTGSVSSIQGDDLNPSATLSDEMQGKAAGLEVKPATGEVRIRGINSINLVSDPLWVLDGMPLYSVRTFDDLQMVVSIHDIESFEVLKDAHSCAMYGSRGANGVILVKTKSGRIK